MPEPESLDGFFEDQPTPERKADAVVIGDTCEGCEA